MRVAWSLDQKGPFPEFFYLLRSPVSWGESLVRNATLKDWFLKRESGFHKNWSHSMVAWPQSEYVGDTTEIACLTTLNEDLQFIFNKTVHECLPTSVHYHNVHPLENLKLPYDDPGLVDHD